MIRICERGKLLLFLFFIFAPRSGSKTLHRTCHRTSLQEAGEALVQKSKGKLSLAAHTSDVWKWGLHHELKVLLFLLKYLYASPRLMW